MISAARTVCAASAAVLALWMASALDAAAQDPPADRCAVDRSRPDVVAACYAAPTDRYGHGVFGQAPGEPGEWAELRVAPRDRMGADGALPPSAFISIALPSNRVFEDLAPRLIDIDGDGRTEILTIEADLAYGGLLALYALEDGVLTRRAQNDPIGQSNRWLAPVGVADLDGDGAQEIAYVDRPHLAGKLRVVRLEGGVLRPVRGPDRRALAKAGFTNHRFGVAAIPGGVRDCGAGPELIVADFSWREIRAVRLADGRLTDRALPLKPDEQGFAKALSCAD